MCVTSFNAVALYAQFSEEQVGEATAICSHLVEHYQGEAVACKYGMSVI